ncbi:MAG: tRNA lysidine(34) synthetase TilS, partial [Pseudomonadota bacterium]
MISANNPDQIFRDVPNDGPVIVAVSGGSDSIALLHLASVWSCLKNVELKVVTVDHGLRPEAAAEAGFVAGVSESLNIPHFTLAWDGVKPSSGVSEAARNARYMLIEEFASDIGACAILVGHTINDQAETIWMRNSRHGGNPQWRGLSGMAKQTVLPSGLRLFRPLFHSSRAELREYLRAIGQSWIEDPSNLDRSYERVRARQSLQSSEIGIDAICRLGALLGRQRKLISDKTFKLLQEHLVVSDGPVFEAPDGMFENPDKNSAILMVQLLIAIAGGREHLVTYETAQSVIDLPVGSRMSAGYAIAERKKHAFRFFREKRFLPTMHVNPF